MPSKDQQNRKAKEKGKDMVFRLMFNYLIDGFVEDFFQKDLVTLILHKLLLNLQATAYTELGLQHFCKRSKIK